MSVRKIFDEGLEMVDAEGEILEKPKKKTKKKKTQKKTKKTSVKKKTKVVKKKELDDFIKEIVEGGETKKPREVSFDLDSSKIQNLPQHRQDRINGIIRGKGKASKYFR